MGEHGLGSGSARSRREFSRRMESLRQEVNSPQQLQPIRRGWKLGGEDFLDRILDKIKVPTKEAHPGRERDEDRAGQSPANRAGRTQEARLDQGGAEAAAQGR